MSHLGSAGGTAAAAAHEQMALDLGITGTTAFLPATFAELMAMHTRVRDQYKCVSLAQQSLSPDLRGIGVYWCLFNNHYTRKCIHKR
jgi:hypothetical protein